MEKSVVIHVPCKRNVDGGDELPPFRVSVRSALCEQRRILQVLKVHVEMLQRLEFEKIILHSLKRSAFTCEA